MGSLPSERVVLARYVTPDGEIQLQQRSLSDGAPAFEIISDGVFLMASYNQVSARALASYALEVVQPRSGSELRVLIGGLGMGFTVQETLTNADASTEISVEISVEVVEISPHIIAWNRTYFAPLNGRALADPRVSLIQDDLYTILCTSPPAAYDAILLDVDNGPSWLAYENNARLYTIAALKRWAALLRSGGVFAVWSAQPEPAFLGRLERMETRFCQPEEIVIVEPSHKQEPISYFIYQGVAH